VSGSLGITQITAPQNQKEVTANAALIRLDNALTATFDANVTAGNVTVTTAQMQQAVQIRAINATVVGRTVTLPGVARVILLHNNAGNTQSVDFIRGTTTLKRTVGQTVIARLDGIANGLVRCCGGRGDLGMAMTGGRGLPIWPRHRSVTYALLRARCGCGRTTRCA